MPVQTPCKNCVFAQYEQNTQIGCAAGELDKLIAAGVPVDEVYDEEKEFFLVRDICYMTNTDPQVSEEQLRARIDPPYNTILLCQRGVFQDDVNDMLGFFMSQKHKPQKQHVIIYPDNYDVRHTVTSGVVYSRAFMEDAVNDMVLDIIDKSKCFITLVDVIRNNKPPMDRVIDAVLSYKLKFGAIVPETSEEDGFAITTMFGGQILRAHLQQQALCVSTLFTHDGAVELKNTIKGRIPSLFFAQIPNDPPVTL